MPGPAIEIKTLILRFRDGPWHRSSIDAINPAQKLWGLAIPYGEGESR